MTDQMDEQLERGLASLTEWQGPSPKLWRRALAAADVVKPQRNHLLRFNWRSPKLLYGTAAVVFLAIAATLMTQATHALEFVAGGTGMTFDRAGDGSNRAEGWRWSLSSRADPSGMHNLIWRIAGQDIAPTTGESADDGRFSQGAFGDEGAQAPPNASQSKSQWLLISQGGSAPKSFISPSSSGAQDSAGRQVVRKATIELKTEDVRAAFAKVKLVLSAAQGEYVQDSSLTGSGETAQANLTLRVAADRLGEVLGRLNELGTVISERTEGEDVTAQTVDLEARLRNETRVEVELLELLEKRKDAPLKEILELRQSLAAVRNVIEQLTARREHLSRLVSLATVLVIIRAEDAPPPEQPGIGAFFGRSMTNAWDNGLTLLIRTFATLLHVLVGGLIWWVLLVGAVVLIRRAIQRSAARVAAGD